MSRTIIILAEAETEVLEAALWYEQQNPQVAKRFIDAFRTAFVRISGHPFQYQLVEEDIRRAPLGGFPHGLLYAVTDDHVVILSCLSWPPKSCSMA